MGLDFMILKGRITVVAEKAVIHLIKFLREGVEIFISG